MPVLQFPKADVLVLAGDIHVGRTNVTKAVNTFAEDYKHVIYVPGNHEYYTGLGINDFELPKLANNVHFLNPGVTTIEGVKFAGATLWTNFRNSVAMKSTAERYINDFKRTKISADIMVEEHGKQLSMLAESGADVIVTHFMPRIKLVHPRWQLDPVAKMLNGYFANDITTVQPKLWLYGHTHDRGDQTIGETRFIANPLGYPGENREPYEVKIIELA